MSFCTSRSPLRAVPEAGWLPWPDCSSCHLLTVTFLLLEGLTHCTQSPASEGQGEGGHWSPGLPPEADDPTCPHVPWAGSLPCLREEGPDPGSSCPRGSGLPRPRPRAFLCCRTWGVPEGRPQTQEGPCAYPALCWLFPLAPPDLATPVPSLFCAPGG